MHARSRSGGARLLAVIATTLAIVALPALAPPAGAAGVAYVDGFNVWLASPDGASKLQLTTTGTADAPWQWPAQGLDGKTVAVQNKSLSLFGADGKLAKINVLPYNTSGTIPVYPIGLDMDWRSQAVAYGYSICGFACNTVTRGYWLTFSDNQGLYPTNPQGVTYYNFPTFYQQRVMATDDGGRLFVQPDVPEAPFTTTFTGWLDASPLRITRAAVAPAGRLVAIEWTRYDGANLIGEGIKVGRHQGTVPSDVTSICDLPVAAKPTQPTFSPDGTQIAWADAEGVKVAGVPNLDAGGSACTLTAPAKVIAASGSQPHFGGVDVAGLLGKPAGGGGPTPNGPAEPGTTLTLTLPKRLTRSAFAKGFVLRVKVPGAGRVTASATVPRSVARRLGIRAARTTLLARGGTAAAATVTVARGSATAKAAGTVSVRLRPTPTAKRRVRRLKGATLTLNITQGAARTTGRLRLR